MKKITLSYEQAIDRLQTIVDALEYCKKRLQQTEKDVQIILQDGEE